MRRSIGWGGLRIRRRRATVEPIYARDLVGADRYVQSRSTNGTSAGRVLSTDDDYRFRARKPTLDMYHHYAGTPAVALRDFVIRLTTESTADPRPGTNASDCIVQPACPASTVTVCASGICSATQRWCRGGMTRSRSGFRKEVGTSMSAPQRVESNRAISASARIIAP